MQGILTRARWASLIAAIVWSVNASAGIPAAERDVLTSLYASTGGARWTNGANWNGGVGTECNWYGVSCDGSESHVTGISLSGNNLVGALPDFGKLVFLESFDLSLNQLTGPIPSLGGLTALRSFYVYSNQLTGPLPSLTGLKSLQDFIASGNQLEGSIPGLGGLPALRGFYVYGNQLTGSIPSFSGATSLQVFDAGLNQLSGPIPALGELKSLQYFYAFNNQLTGPIPPLAGLTGLQDFQVFGNQLTGSIPSLAGLNSLQNFDVSSNLLTGTIPPLGGLSGLQEFHAYNNQLTGTIPSLSGLSALRELDVAFNQLSGPIPSLGGLSALRGLYIYSNQLTGSFPSLGGLNNLQDFQIFGNRLTGPVSFASGSLLPGNSSLCGNSLVTSGDPAIDAAWISAQGSNWFDCQTVAGAPTCTLTASPSTIALGGSTTLTARCTPEASSYFWSANAGLASTVASGVVSPLVTTTYAVAGGSAGGAGNTASVTVTVTSNNPFLVVKAIGTGYGIVASSPSGISCYTPQPGVAYLVAPDCTQSYASGTIVTLAATPVAGSYFAGWSGACTGSTTCSVTMYAARDVTANFRLLPFTATPNMSVTPFSSTLTTRVNFNATDIGKQGSVFLTGWVPVSALAAMGILSGDPALGVARRPGSPNLGAAFAGRVGGIAAEADASSFVLVQLTPTGWQLVTSRQLTPYASGVLGEAMATQNVLNNADTSKVTGSQFCVGYGSSSAEMVSAGRMVPVATLGPPVSTGSCNVAASLPPSDYTGLFWNASESGWGISLTQQSSMIFAAWYVYDAAGKPTWYVMPSCPLSGKTCTGPIYGVAGGTPPGATWNGSAKVVSQAGTGTLAFSNSDNATFSYTLNNVTASRSITRQPLAAGTSAPMLDYSALWWNADESGWGVALTQQYGMIFVTMFTYDASGRATWYVASSCPVVNNGCTGTLYQVNGGTPPTVAWNNPSKELTVVGNISFVFTDSSIGTMSYTINGLSGTRPISRQPL